MPSVASANLQQNYLKWNTQYDWPEDGDEWKGQAQTCGIPYDVWKASLVTTLILPNVGPNRNVLEIGCGHGRWSSYLIENSAFCTLVDISPNCLDHCRIRYNASRKVEYFLTTGAYLPHYCDADIDFVWSYDSFVHMAPEVIDQYLFEIARVLRPTGAAIIHHANITDLSSHDQNKSLGWRSAVNNSLVHALVDRTGMRVERQFVYWDEVNKIGVPNHADSITVIRQPTPLPERKVRLG